MDFERQALLEMYNPWWTGVSFQTGINRLSMFPNLSILSRSQELLFILGVRRSGKSTIMFQIIRDLLDKGIHKRSILYLNLDDPFWQKWMADPSFLRNLIEEYKLRHQDIQMLYLFIDEVQNYEHWALSLKVLYDTKHNLKWFLTGSNAALLQSEIATRLSGRYFSIRVSPLKYPEYLTFSGFSSETILQRRTYLGPYIKFGGFPRVVLEPDEKMKRELLLSYFETIYLKDIAASHGIRNIHDLIYLLTSVLSSVGSPVSYNRLSETFDLSIDTVKEYIAAAEDAFLIKLLHKFDYSARKQMINQKKIYSIDTGLTNAVSFSFSENLGRAIENIVYNSLIQKYPSVYYHKGSYECDFVCMEGYKITAAYQVSLNLSDEKTRKREIRGLIEALDTYNLKDGTILTFEGSETLELDGKQIQVIPISEWLCEEI